MANGAACDMINEMLACNCGQQNTQQDYLVGVRVSVGDAESVGGLMI